ncbi:MAG: hypothetical protein ACI915_000382 [Gammaproteobacteria bacterium]|jgi:hypothetical protein
MRYVETVANVVKIRNFSWSETRDTCQRLNAYFLDSFQVRDKILETTMMEKEKHLSKFRSIVFALTGTVMLAAVSPPASTDIILDPTGTVAGDIGLEVEVFGNGSTQHYTGSTWLYGTVDPTANSYTVPVVAGKENINFYIYMYNFADTNGAYLRYYVYNQPSVAENATKTLNLKRAGGLISGSVSVNAGATVESITLRTSGSDASVPVSYIGSVNSYPGVSPVSADQPFPVASNVRAYGSVRISLSAGCSITRNLGNKYFDVEENTVAEVNWTFDLTGVGCPTGNLEGIVDLPGLLTSGVILRETYGNQVSVYGENSSKSMWADPLDGSYAFSLLPAGMYASRLVSYFQAPYGRTIFPYQSSAFEIVDGETTIFDFNYPVGTVHLAVDPVGTWDLSDVNSWYSSIYTSGTDGTTYSYDLQLTDGQFDYAAPAGSVNAQFQRAQFYSNVDGEYRSEYLYHYLYGSNRPTGAAVAGEALDLGVVTIDSSEALVTFQVAPVAGQASPLLRRIALNGAAYIYDPDTNALLTQSSINVDARNNTTQLETISVLVRGISGNYALSATAYDVDGKAYTASFELNLGEPQNTPTGMDIPQDLLSEDGSVVATVTFDYVTGEGTTTISEVGTGPSAPTNFAIFENQGVNGNTGKFYYDIITTATFDGLVQVCLNYDDTDMSEVQEAKLELGHDKDGDGQWDIITDKPDYPDTEANIICGLTESFSIFAGFVPLDSDNDDVLDSDDNCKDEPNFDQLDTDGDGVGDACEPDDDGDGVADDYDNCPMIANPDQANLDGDEFGDACDSDIDGDNVDNGSDNCPSAPNTDQSDLDGDGTGDACEDDTDDDGIPDDTDLCPLIASDDNGDLDGDGVGNVCDSDMDGDGVDNAGDNCPSFANSDQSDLDSDGAGDACDADVDGDSVGNDDDNCPLVANAGQTNLDDDEFGDACDTDIDGDDVGNESDNCPNESNSDQFDYDYDGLGDVCDTDDDDDGVADGDDNCPNTPLDAQVEDGCSSSQLFVLVCPTDGDYRNHGRYVSCVAEEANAQVESGLISEDDKDAVVSAAAKSDIGKKD